MNIQAMWTHWSAQNPTNNMMIRKVQREAFFAGAEMMRDHFHSSERIASDLIQQQGDPLRVIEGGKDD